MSESAWPQIRPDGATDEVTPGPPATATEILNAEELTDQSNVAEANRILMEGRAGLADARPGILAAGRAFNELKPMLPHGSWLPRLKIEAERSGHSIRSIQEYMKAAKEADAQNAELRVFAKATDPQAVAIAEAAKRAQQRVADAITASDLTRSIAEPKTKRRPRKSPIRLEGIYPLPLPMSGDEKDATDELMASPNWPNAQMFMLDVWRRLLAEYGYLVVTETAPETVATGGSVPGFVAADSDLPDIFRTGVGGDVHTQA